MTSTQGRNEGKKQPRIGAATIFAVTAGVVLLAVLAAAVIILRATEPARPEDHPAQKLNVAQLDGPIVLSPGERVDLYIGRNHPSVGIWQEITREADPAVATVEKVTDSPTGPDVPPGGDGGSTNLIITAIAPGQTSVAVADCFREMPDANGICHDDKGPRPYYTIEIVVEAP